MGKYEEALAKARSGKSLEEIFPEMKEIDDEMIRRGLVKLLTVASEAYLVDSTGIKKDSYLAYLEKQKHKPAEWSEEEIRTILDDFAECKDTYTSCINRLKSLRLQPKQKWTKEDKTILNNIIRVIHMKSIAPLDEMDDRDRYKKYEAFLESIPERFNQPQQEWSEEDEKHIEALILASDRCMGKWHCCNEQCEISEHLDWLKSLSPPQYCENCKLKRSVENWKPSEQ